MHGKIFDGKLNCVDRVAISGMGCIAGAGEDVGSLWANLLNGVVSCGPVPEWLFKTILNYPVFVAPRQCFSARARELVARVCSDFRQESVSRTILLALSAVAEALTHARISLEYLRNKRVGIALGTTVGCTFHNEEYYIAWRSGLKPDLAPVQFYLGGNVASTLHHILGTSGPQAVITNACASATDAIGLARTWLTTGQCDLAIAGGADELSRVAYNGFAGLMLSDTEPCRPFNEDRQGLNLGEGAGVLVLEQAEHLRERQGIPLGWVRGYGSAADAYHPTAPHPQGRGLKMALRQALEEAGQEASICLINAHGTGTKANDLAETSALADILPEPDNVTLVSTKGITGHTLGAAGAIEAILTLMALRAGKTPGTVGCSTPDPQFLLTPLAAHDSRVLTSKFGISQSLAFGGGNGVLVLEAEL